MEFFPAGNFSVHRIFSLNLHRTLILVGMMLMKFELVAAPDTVCKGGISKLSLVVVKGKNNDCPIFRPIWPFPVDPPDVSVERWHLSSLVD